MAKTKTSTIGNMTAGNVGDDTRLYFAVQSDLYTIENGVVSDTNNVTLAEKVFVQVRYIVDNDQDTTKENKNSEWTQVSAANYPTLSAGFLADLKKIFDAERTVLGLDPV